MAGSEWLLRGGSSRLRLGAVVAVLLACMAPRESAAESTMALPGGFSTGTSGAATYAIPIAVPPGTAGLAPSLSLEYSSQGSNGVVGIGWSLSGLLSIGRCPQTPAQDGVRGGVNYDANDRFCLDGQRLAAISGGYGADGTEYRTEIDSFTRVISHGAAGTGPAWFEVHTKAGQVMEFGHTTDSLILATGKSTARNWAVNKVSDTKGNYFTVTYTNDTANGQAYPIEVDYTGNVAANLAPYNKVQFVYAARPDVSVTYQAGSLTNTTVRLTEIKTYAGSALVGDYKLAYAQSADTGRSRLSSIVLCGDNGATCVPATNLSWTDNAPGSFATASSVNPPGSGWTPHLGDFNADGKTDILWCNSNPANGNSCTNPAVFWLSNGDGTFTTANSVAPPGDFWLPYLGDFNGDGKTDILWCNANSANGNSCTNPAVFWFSNGNGTFTTVSSINPPGNFWTPYLGDFNGDGRTDILWCNANSANGNSCTNPAVFWFSNGDGSFATVSSINPPGNFWVPYLGDFNGDGKTDVLWCNANFANGNSCTNPAVFWFSNGDGSFATVSSINPPGNFWLPYLGDFNGDGKTDILWCNANYANKNSCTNPAVFWLSRGDGSFITASSIAPPGDLWTPYLIDFNGDGKTDILWCNANSANGNSCTNPAVFWQSKGDGTFTTVSSIAPPGNLWLPYPGDFNGDGKTDILWCNANFAWGNSCTPPTVFWLSVGPTQGAGVSDLLMGVTTGVGATTTITYKPLTSSSVYTKDTNAVYPVQDLQPPMPVVSRVDTLNGIGGIDSMAYSYAGAKIDISGYGPLGFRQMTATDLQTNILQTTNYRQDFPYIGLVASMAKVLGTQTLNLTTNSYQFSNVSGAAAVGPGKAPYRASVSQTVEQATDLDGAAIPTATTTYQYDAYNNATQVVISTSDGYGKTTTNTYTNDTTRWLLGRLSASTVTSQAPQQLGQYCTLPWGGTIGNGQGVTAYSAASAPLGQACSAIAQTRTCTNGTLSGSYSQQSCTPMACTLPWGGTVASGQTVTAYSAATAPVGQACSTIAETRTCSLGALSGSYAQQSCSAVCALPWGGTINQGQSVTAYSAASVPSPQVCSSVAQTRTCAANGALSGSFANQSCTVRQPKTLFLTSGTTWTVPADWSSTNNSVDCIGGGGGGTRGGAGGGAAWSRSINVTLTPNSSVGINVGGGGGGAYGATGGAGGATWFNATSLSNAVTNGSSLSCGAQGGSGGLDLAGSGAGGAGGAAASGVGATKYSGGGGAGRQGVPPFDGGGGGGAGGLHGSGATAAAITGASGDAGAVGGGPTPSTVQGTPGNNGGNGTEYSAAFGSGGGASGGRSNTSPASAGNGGHAGVYGGGGGGGGQNLGSGLDGTGGAGGSGLIVITYTPAI